MKRDRRVITVRSLTFDERRAVRAYNEAVRRGCRDLEFLRGLFQATVDAADAAMSDERRRDAA